MFVLHKEMCFYKKKQKQKQKQKKKTKKHVRFKKLALLLIKDDTYRYNRQGMTI